MSLLRWKYVVIEHPVHEGLEVPVLLPECVEHAAVKTIGKPVAAGFCELRRDGSWAVFGHSVSLGLVPRVPTDPGVLQFWFAQAPVGEPAATISQSQP